MNPGPISLVDRIIPEHQPIACAGLYHLPKTKQNICNETWDLTMPLTRFIPIVFKRFHKSETIPNYLLAKSSKSD